MSFKDEVKKEKTDLTQNKRPYETAAFIIFAVLFLQQFILLMYRLIEFIIDLFNSRVISPFFSMTSLTTPAFFNRICAIDTTSIFIVILAILSLVLYYFLIYVLVFRYCQRHGYAKWTWTTFIVFGPSIFFIPPYIFFAVYAFRPYFFRFIKKVVTEYKAFDMNTQFSEEKPEEPVEEKPEVKPEEKPEENPAE